MTISMDQPPPAPRIHVPPSVSARPGSPWVYSVPATGQAPLTFSAQGLPPGLSLAASSGILSGTMPAAGSYPVVISASNSVGSARATLRLVSGDTLSLTPAMGWNSYDSFGGSVTEQETMDAATTLKAKLQPFGWNTVVVDYLWYDGEQIRPHQAGRGAGSSPSRRGFARTSTRKDRRSPSPPPAISPR